MKLFKTLAVIRTACLLTLCVLSVFVLDQVHKINMGIWYQNTLLTEGLEPEAPDVPDLEGSGAEIITISSDSKCQIDEDNFCTEIAYIWRQFELMDAKRAEVKAFLFSHMFGDNREGQIQPRRNQ